MKIVFAKNIGFCSGVKRAMAIAKDSLKKDPKPVQFLGYLIHNEEVIKSLKEKGGKFVFSQKLVKPGTLITGAHGEVDLSLVKNQRFLSLAKNKHILIKKTTCPLVKNAQNKANLLFKEGYQVIIIGEKNHPETRGIKSYTENRAIVIENENQAKDLPKFKKLGVVSQTTQALDNINRILKILRNKTKKLKWFNTICPKVIIRQKELSQILKEVCGILVIGSPSSSNTNHLIEMVKKSKKPLWWINSLGELKKINPRTRAKLGAGLVQNRSKTSGSGLGDINSLGVVSGTSAPDWEIKKIKNWLKSNENCSCWISK